MSRIKLGDSEYQWVVFNIQIQVIILYYNFRRYHLWRALGRGYKEPLCCIRTVCKSTIISIKSLIKKIKSKAFLFTRFKFIHFRSEFQPTALEVLQLSIK